MTESNSPLKRSPLVFRKWSWYILHTDQTVYDIDDSESQQMQKEDNVCGTSCPPKWTYNQG